MHTDTVDIQPINNPKTRPLRIALLGNPNSGKSSIFNQLTGLRQKVGNFPGVTVDKKLGRVKIKGGQDITLIDFPGSYSFYPSSQDERLVVRTLCNPKDPNFPDAIIYIADLTKLEKHMLLFSQLQDIGIPVILALNMSDVAETEGIGYNIGKLSQAFKSPVVAVSGRTGAGIDNLKAELSKLGVQDNQTSESYPLSGTEKQAAEIVQAGIPGASTYQALLIAHHVDWLPFVKPAEQAEIKDQLAKINFESLHFQVKETMARYDRFTPIIQKNIKAKADEPQPFTGKLDKILTHPVAGPIIFFVLMALVFQAIYAWATYPMDLIEGFFGTIGSFIQTTLPEGWFSSLLTDGLLAGLGGVFVFIPQIAILFFLISILEEIGYMARAAFLFDRVMQVFGLNGRSIVALISGGACAIPAIMSTRTISNWKERLITIMVTPLISCSARIPVYTVLIGFVVPAQTVWGFFNLQGLAFMALYILGIIAALLSALVFKLILKTNESSYLMLEMPTYRRPVFRNVFLTVWEKVKTFVLEAGKVILILSLVLWVLSSYGMPEQMAAAETEATSIAEQQQLSTEAAADVLAAKKLEASFAGQLGQLIEPVIEPLGFDWKIGIALLTSFAAREVFVGTMATIYSIGSTDDEFAIRDKMAQEVNPVTGAPVYNMATSLSLLLFYVFAMQCLSTLAVVRRETKSWKWPIIQFVFMTALAYFSSLAVYQIFA